MVLGFPYLPGTTNNTGVGEDQLNQRVDCQRQSADDRVRIHDFKPLLYGKPLYHVWNME